LVIMAGLLTIAAAGHQRAVGLVSNWTPAGWRLPRLNDSTDATSGEGVDAPRAWVPTTFSSSAVAERDRDQKPTNKAVVSTRFVEPVLTFPAPAPTVAPYDPPPAPPSPSTTPSTSLPAPPSPSNTPSTVLLGI